jgi:Zn-dependent protease with chaperone function
MRVLALLLMAGLITVCVAPTTKVQKVSSVAAELEAKKQRELAAQAWVETEKRLYRIGYPILENGTVLCKEQVRPSIGVIAWNNSHFDEAWRDAIKRLYGIDDLLQIAYVVPASPAAQAGMQAQDIPISINEWFVPVGEDAAVQFAEKLTELAAEKKALSITYRRGEAEHTVELSPREVCAYDLVLENSEAKNAYADGERIVVLRGLMDFFKTDEEAALVIAHELAHNAMGHIDAKKANAVMGGAVGLLADLAAAYYGVNTQGQFTDIGAKAGAATYSVEFEQEADYVGLYFMELAGYNTDGVANFWRRMAIQSPQSIQMKSSHPTTPERFIAIEQAIQEIGEKRSAGQVLLPDYKEEKSM